jgi:hypothetical protein
MLKTRGAVQYAGDREAIYSRAVAPAFAVAARA